MLVDLVSRSNINVQLGAILLDADPRREIGGTLLQISGVTGSSTIWQDQIDRFGSAVCPGIVNHTSCKEARCRRCWDRNWPLTAFPLHNRGRLLRRPEDRSRQRRHIAA